MREAVATAVLAVGLAAATAGAQVIRGQVRDADSRQPIAGAAIVVRDTARRNIGFARSDNDGSFFLRIPVAGYSVHIVRVGFAPESLSTAGFDVDTTNVLVDMRPVAVRLTAAVIEAEKRGIKDMKVMGLNMKAVATHIITPSEIAVAARGARTYLDAIRTALPAGVMVNERALCVGSNRSRSLGTGAECSMIFVDGVRIERPDVAIDLVQPAWLDHALFLNATDAGVRFGTGASGGALLLFTKYGGYALEDAVSPLASFKTP